jgi:PAS domain S-box-containing protein
MTRPAGAGPDPGVDEHPFLPGSTAQALLELGSDAMVVTDLSGYSTYATPSAAALLGHPVSELVGRHLHDLVHHQHPDGLALPREQCELVTAAGAGRPADVDGVAHWRADGRLLVLDCRMRPLSAHGRTIGAVTRFTESFPRQSPDGGPPGVDDAFVGVNGYGVVVDWSAGAEALTGWTAQQVIGRVLSATLLLPTDRELVQAILDGRERDRAGDARRPHRISVRRADGAAIRVQLTGGWVLYDGQRRFHAFLRAEAGAPEPATLARNEAMYHLLVAASGDVISQHGHDDEILYISESVEALTGWPPDLLIGRRLSSLVHPEDRDALRWGALDAEDSQAGQFAYRLRHRDGHHVWVETTAAVLRDNTGMVSETLMCTRDISVRRARERAEHEESRLQGLGRLAAGLAHEINTPIQYVGDNARFLAEAFAELLDMLGVYRQALDSTDAISWPERLGQLRRAEAELELDYLQTEVPSAVSQTLAGIDRVATIVRAMKTFSHPGHEEHVPADLNEALTATATITRHQVSAVAELVVSLGPLPPVRCNIAELNQAFLNLIINAADAVESTGRRGTITLTTELDGDHAVIRVEDTGGGIPDHVLAKIYEPFFTTKEPGRGSGQGLAQVRTVVQDGHRGTVDVATTVGVGTVFTLRLPVDGPGSG